MYGPSSIKTVAIVYKNVLKSIGKNEVAPGQLAVLAFVFKTKKEG
jgi:hypothetical protein